MDSEIESLIKVWILAITSLCYCHFVARRIPRGTARFFSLLPIFSLFLILPLNLHSVHLCGPTAFFLGWLCTFKLLLFSFDHGPLSSPNLNLIHFISIACLPIKLKHGKHPKSDQKSRKSGLTLLLFKTLLLALVIGAYNYRPYLHKFVILLLYCCHVYLALELVLAISATPALVVFGFELEPQFDEPYLTTSLQDFWGRRWNLMVTGILRPTVYDPIRRIFSRIGPFLAGLLGLLASFLVSGLMHELMYYYLTRVPPTWEVTGFFVLQGACVAAEVVAKRVVAGRWKLHGAVSGKLTLGFVAMTGYWLFFPQLTRNEVDLKAIREYHILANFIKNKVSNVSP